MGEERDPSYNPNMDDPNFRRRRKTTTRRTEEVVEETDELDDDEYEYVEEGEEDMSDSPGVGSAIGSALAAGAKQAAAAQINDMLTTNVTKALVSAGVLKEGMQNNMGVQMVIKALAPALIIWAAEKFPDQIPQSALVSEGAKLALTSASVEVIQPALMLALPMFKQLASATQEHKELEEKTEKTEDPEIEISVVES